MWNGLVSEVKASSVKFLGNYSKSEAFIIIKFQFVSLCCHKLIVFRKLPEILLSILLGKTLIPHEELYFLSQTTKFSAELSRRSFKRPCSCTFLVKEKKKCFFLAFEHFAYIMRVLHKFYTWVDNFNNPYLYCCRGEHLANLSH